MGGTVLRLLAVPLQALQSPLALTRLGGTQSGAKVMQRILWFISITCLLLGSSALAGADEDAYKSEFIVKLFSYVEWPPGVAPDTGVTIGVIGKSTLLDQLKAQAAQRTSDGKKTTVKALDLDGDYSGCQILFFQTQDKAELAKILKRVGAKSVLTVGDSPGFAGFGVMLNFYSEVEDGKSKVKFEVNTIAVGDAKLKISSSLLKLARVI